MSIKQKGVYWLYKSENLTSSIGIVISSPLILNYQNSESDLVQFNISLTNISTPLTRKFLSNLKK